MNSSGKPKPPNRTIVARHLAEELGVSVSTISRAFSPNSNVARDTRERILAHAKAIGYRPNPFARSLSTQRTQIVSIFISDFFNPFYPEVLATMTQALQSHGLRVMLFHVPSGKTADEILTEAFLYQPEYIIVMTATVSFHTALAASDSGAHMIFFNRYVPGSDTLSVTCDNARGGREIAEFFLNTGHRNMAYVAGTPDATTSIDRGRGFAERCAEAGLTIVQDNHARVFSYEDGQAAAKRLIRAVPDLDAIFCANDIVAFGAIDALRHELGLNVPGDISVVGFDDVAMASWPSHSLTTYRHPMRRMTEATVELIRQIEEDPDAKPASRKIAGELVIRASHRDRGDAGRTIGQT